uniref:Uncharacterized protein n=1 Tax=Yersinia enterocolitica TaxID=630 RepID=B0RKV1_YEREN|nr:hypothetical protein [Yersinia enterocolitica]
MLKPHKTLSVNFIASVNPMLWNKFKSVLLTSIGKKNSTKIVKSGGHSKGFHYQPLRKIKLVR